MERMQASRVRFGLFELDLRVGELHANGHSQILSEQVLEVLKILIAHDGDIATREEIKRRLWPNDTVVEFEHSINSAIKKLRRALEDSADEPRYIETIPRRGYRLMIPVEWIADGSEASPESPLAANAAKPAAPSNGSFTGKIVSHYRVLEVIGGGGMGLVYRAEDLKLGRAVAIKFLPEEVGDEPRARERFAREAKAVSALSHPNICSIYEFDEFEGHPFIVMELLRGQTLREHLAEGRYRLTTPEGLEVATQIASGLEGAHEQGIIHRDIKPANIFITEKHVAKILDFGVAKVLESTDVEASAESSGDALSARVPPGLTRTGLKLGTAGYMSPEQIRGEPLDTRTDIFSFGLVLYEMATGERAFTGETEAILHDAILNRAPQPVRQLNAEVAPKLVTAINRCLEKDRDGRYHNMQALLADLSLSNRASKMFRRRLLVLAATAIVLVTAILAVLFWPRRPTSTAPLRMRQLMSTSPSLVAVALAPNGRDLAYREETKGIALLRIDTGETRFLPGTLSFTPGSWVPDGDHLFATKDEEPGTWIISIWDGQVRKFQEATLEPVPSPDGRVLLFEPDDNDGEIWVMEASGDSKRKLLSTLSPWHLLDAAWSPTSRRILRVSSRIRRDGRSKAVVRDVQLDSCDLAGSCLVILSDPRILNHWSGSPANVLWLPGGRMILALNEPPPNEWDTNLWSLEVDPDTGRSKSELTRITSWVGAAQDGLEASADGKRIVFAQIHPQNTLKIADIRPDGALGSPRPLSAETWLNGMAAWTPDSSAVVFATMRNGQAGIFRQSIGSGIPECLACGGYDYGEPAPSPDGKWLLYNQYFQDGSARLMRISLEGGPPASVLEGSYKFSCSHAPATLCLLAELKGDSVAFSLLDPIKGRGREMLSATVGAQATDSARSTSYSWSLSPDGKTVALVVAGKDKVQLLDVEAGSKRELPLKGWTEVQFVHWAGDSMHLYFSGSDYSGHLVFHYNDIAIFATDLSGNTRTLFQVPNRQGWIANPIPSPNGRYLLLTDRAWPSNVAVLENF